MTQSFRFSAALTAGGYQVIGKIPRRLCRVILRLLPSAFSQRVADRGLISAKNWANKTQEVEFDWTFVQRVSVNEREQRTEPLQPLRVWWLDQVALHSADGVVCADGQRILAESMLKPRFLRQASLERSYAPQNIVYHPGICTTIHSTLSANYGHWFADSLARLYLLAQLHEPVTLLPDDLRDFQRDSLALCQPDQVELETVPANSWVQAEHFVLPDFVRNHTSGYLPREIVEFLRTRIFTGLGLSAAPPRTRRLYISRADVLKRQVANEEAVFACLSRYGFERCLPEKLKFEEEVRLFRSAECVAAPYGSGLTNTLYCEPIKVVEFQIDPPQDLFFWRLSQVLGHEHHFLATSGQADYHRDAMTIDVAMLERKLREILLD